jgi:uncharacterized protein (DUF3084 family)
MTSAYILIAAMLVLGGVIAVLGDRLGSKIGKARLRLFNLRPRQTAQVITILTGTLISASTFGLLLTLSESLRQGIFDLDAILKEKRLVESELKQVKLERDRVERARARAKKEQIVAEKSLQEIDRKFVRAQNQIQIASQQAKNLRKDIKTLVGDRQQLIQQKNNLSRQTVELRDKVQTQNQQLQEREQQIVLQNQNLARRQQRVQELEKRQASLQEKISEQDSFIGQLDKKISETDRLLQSRENQLQELESQQTYLKREVELLEEYYQTYQELREKRIAIVRGQVLAFAAIRIVDANGVRNAIDRLLQLANRNAIAATQPEAEKVDERVVRITEAEVNQITEQLQDRQDYVIRIISAGNYVQGEKEVRVFADVAPNKQIFQPNQTIAAISVDSNEVNEQNLQNKLDLLFSASQFRARRAGILGNIQVEDGQIKTILNFIERLSQSGEIPDEIKAIATETTYTVGPLKLRLVAMRNGQVLFST